MRLAIQLVVLVFAAVCSSCLRSTTVISVKADGSGTVVQETGLSPQALAMVKTMAGSGTDAKMPADLFGEDQAKQAADLMGVTFVSGEPIKTAELEGYRARFAFNDVRQIRMKMNQAPTKGLTGSSAAAEPPFRFDFERRGASSQLTITVPESNAGSNPMAKMPGMGGTSNPEQNQQAMAMMKLMLQNLFVDVSLDVDGRIVNTNAPHVQGSRVTLLQIDFNQLLADEAAFRKLQSATDIKALAGVPGLKVLTSPKVTVEFASRLPQMQ
jgi:hypothetical protein